MTAISGGRASTPGSDHAMRVKRILSFAKTASVDIFLGCNAFVAVMKTTLKKTRNKAAAE
jgi:hypothetical protein